MSDTGLLVQDLKQCNSSVFFEKLEKYLNFKIPQQLQNILQLNAYNCAINISKFDEDSISDMTDFMRNDFNDTMIPQGKNKSDYLGLFLTKQQNFKFVSGEMRMLRTISEKCRTLYDEHRPSVSISTSQQVTDTTFTTSPITPPKEKTNTASTDLTDKHDIQEELCRWIRNEHNIYVILSDTFEISLTVNSEATSAGVTSYMMKCPVEQCTSSHKVTKESYPSYYKKKKGLSNSTVTLRTARWSWMGTKKHLLRSHAINSNAKRRDHGDSTESDDSDNNTTAAALQKQYDDESDFVISSEENDDIVNASSTQVQSEIELSTPTVPSTSIPSTSEIVLSDISKAKSRLRSSKRK